MNIQEIKDTLKNVSFAPSNLDMGWEWDIKPTKIYDESNVVLEKGFSIRTTFMRPDINSGEIERGYGRWMYVPQNISIDGLVKTAWVCAELIVKHELMEAFLYERKKIFDPHKNLKDIQNNSETVDVPERSEVPKEVPKKKEPTKSSEEIFHKQNIGNHVSEIDEYLDRYLGEGKETNEGHKRYSHYLSFVDHFEKKGVIVSNSNGKVIESLTGEDYTLSNVKEVLDKYEEDQNDPGMINSIISKHGYTEVSKKPTDDDDLGELFVYSNPKNESKYVLHLEGKFVSLVNKKKDILGTAEGDNYTKEYVEKVLNGSAK